jgi:hypothetical protein
MSRLTDEELDWRACPEGNSPRWVITHLSQEWNVYIPRIFAGDMQMKVEWPESYVDNKSYSLEQIKADMAKGKEIIMNGLEKLTSEDMAEEIPFFRGTRRRDSALLTFISEIIHHEGQLATMMGTIKRQREK